MAISSSEVLFVSLVSIMARISRLVSISNLFISDSFPFRPLGTFRSEDEDDYEYEFSVLSTRNSKNLGLQTLSACSVRKTRSGTRPRPPI